MPSVIGSLARGVNIENFSERCWEIMSKILMSHYGHQSIRILCNVLDKTENHYSIGLLRGSVFFLGKPLCTIFFLNQSTGMSLWGSKRISTVHTPPIAVLPSLLNVLSSKSSIVSYEVLLAVHRLVKK